MKKATVNISHELKSKIKVYVAKNPPETIQSFIEKTIEKDLKKKEK